MQKVESMLLALRKGDFRKEVAEEAFLFQGAEQERLFELARERRDENFPSREVEARSVIEISNICRRKCNFCNINVFSKRNRYTIQYEKLIEIVEELYSKGRRVFLLQSGENDSRNYIDFISKGIAEIKQKFTSATLMLCLGNLHYEQYKQLKEAGAVRYILKFETSNPELYSQIKPDDSLGERIKCLDQLVELGFEVGTGNIIGLPGQSPEDIMSDLFFLSRFKLLMASCTTFIPGEDSNYKDMPMGDLNLTLNYMALMRILYPKLLIPTTSCLHKAGLDGQYLGLMAGANTVTIHDGTPIECKKHFPIYSVNRFMPDEKHIQGIVSKAGLKLPNIKNHAHAY